MKSVMNHNFSMIPPPQIERSVFDRSHGHKTTFSAGYLVPIMVDEVLPGDTFRMKATFFARMTTFVFPIMDNLFLDTFWFFVPNRLIWENWERFMGASDDADFNGPNDFLIPQMTAGETVAEASLGDHFGLPVGQAFLADALPMALPFRAYVKIYNEWFRDQNLQDKETENFDDGPDSLNDYALLLRGKRHDYFTSCLPWPQKGDSVMLPLGDTAPVVGDGLAIGLWDGTLQHALQINDNSGGNPSALTYAASAETNKTVGNSAVGSTLTTDKKYIGLSEDPSRTHMHTDLTLATAATINQLRQAFAYQKILERDARGGTRYVEMLKAHFGVTSPDFRLQRPEYLGGSSQRINVSTVTQTSVTAATPQGNVAASVSVGAQSGFNKSFVEHGIVIGLANVRADITYQQGMNRMWSRLTRFDFYLPALAHLGEQAVLNKEIFYKNSLGATVMNEAFGYQERWAEYRYKPSQVTGLFRSAASGTLDSWHLALDFGTTLPLLNNTFIEDHPPMSRVVAVSNQPDMLLDCFFDYRCARPMPAYSVPGQIDRF